MKDGPDIARMATLIGDPARSNMLTALMTGKSLTATELAAEAGITAQTASSHLKKLQEGGLVLHLRQGRHRYYSLASDDVATALETLMGLAARSGHLRTRTGPKDPALRRARVCYNHLAGSMGVQMYNAMCDKAYLALTNDGIALTDSGATFVANLGIDLSALPPSRAPMCRECLDWSMRRSHLAGQLGRALLARFEALDWMHREPESRVLIVTNAGETAFRTHFS